MPKQLVKILKFFFTNYDSQINLQIINKIVVNLAGILCLKKLVKKLTKISYKLIFTNKFASIFF